MASLANLLRNDVKSLSRKHNPMSHDRDWLRHVYTTFDIDPASRVAYVRKFRFDQTYIFMIQEYGERMSPRCVSQISNLTVEEEDLITADFGPLTLDEALANADDPSMSSKFLASKSVVNGEIILRFAADRTVKASFTDFSERMKKIVDVEIIDWAQAQQAEVEAEAKPHRNSTDAHLRAISSNTEQMNQLFQESSADIAHLHAQSSSALNLATSASAKIDETTRKLGHVNEETFRQRLNDSEGWPWATSFRFDTLVELVDWIGLKIQAERAERRTAFKNIVDMCVGNFDGFEKGRGVDWDSVCDPSVKGIDLVAVSICSSILLPRQRPFMQGIPISSLEGEGRRLIRDYGEQIHPHRPRSRVHETSRKSISSR